MKDQLLPTLSVIYDELEGWQNFVDQRIAEEDTGEIHGATSTKELALPVLDQIIEHFREMKLDLSKSVKGFNDKY